jgi:hypothetical protein
MHAVSNGLLLSLTELQPILTKLGLNLDAENQSHLPIPFLAGAIMIALLGAWCVRAGSLKQR